MSNTNRAIDALVAEKVMGWKFPVSVDRGTCRGVQDHWEDRENHTIYLPEQLPYFSTEPASDYEVLQHVREKWNSSHLYEFRQYLLDTWRDRKFSLRAMSDVLGYTAGDYSLAALRALGVAIPTEAA